VSTIILHEYPFFYGGPCWILKIPECTSTFVQGFLLKYHKKIDILKVHDDEEQG
jgi:hypothetical protein